MELNPTKNNWKLKITTLQYPPLAFLWQNPLLSYDFLHNIYVGFIP